MSSKKGTDLISGQLPSDEINIYNWLYYHDISFELCKTRLNYEY